MIFLPVSKRKADYLLKRYPDLIQKVSETDGRGYTSIGIPDNRIDDAWALSEVNSALPWRYRRNPVRLKLVPNPKGFSSDAISQTLSSMSYRKLRDRVTGQFGGRCQVCGHATYNKKSRRVAPRVFATWLHSRHPNQNKMMGMREILGVASVCDDCMGPFTLANAVPCDHVRPENRETETQKSIQRMVTHNQTTSRAVSLAIQKSIAERKRRLDNCLWVESLHWLNQQGLLKKEELVLSRRHIKYGYSLTGSFVVRPPASAGQQLSA